MTSVIYDIHKAHSSHIRSALKSNKKICIHSVPFNVRGFHAGRAHVCITKQKFKKRKEKGHPESGRAKMESQWIVELTSSGRVDAVKKGPFPLIIYFPIRHCPARGKNTFIWGTLFCEPGNQEPVHSSIVSIEERERGKSIGRGCHCMCVCVCIYTCLCLFVGVCVWKTENILLPYSGTLFKKTI